jgi:hypothetical integral membrane protein (TIGR02206 family)
MRFVHHWQYFRAGTIDHVVVLTGLVVLTALLARVGRQYDRTDVSFFRETLRRTSFEQWLVAVMAIAWLAGLLLKLRPGYISWDRSLPLHVCDVVGVAGPLAIWTRSRPLRAILHFWGLALSSLAFLVPVIHTGPAHLDYWSYFGGHAAIISPAIYDVIVRGYRPTWTDWRVAALSGAAYVAVVLPIDVLLHANYGYIGQAIAGRSAQVAAWGPWPARVPLLLLTAWGFMAVLVLPWIRSQSGKLSASDDGAEPAQEARFQVDANGGFQQRAA